MKKLYFLSLLIGSTLTFGQTTFTSWNFDGSNLTPNTGTGTISIIGGVTEASTPYPQGNPTTGLSYSISGFPAAGTASGTAGYQVTSSTVGYSGITVKFENRASNTASKWIRYEYTTNGTVWNVLSNNGGALINGFPSSLVSLTLPATCDNNANFSFRMVSIFDPAGADYVAVGATSTYGTGGTWRIDNVSLEGTVLSTKSFNAIEGLTMYPNPLTGNTLNFATAANSELNVQIFDILGNQVINTKVTNNTLNTAKLNAGVYIVKITEEGNTATRKLVVK